MESISQSLSGHGAPTKNTVGNIGDIYTDLNTETKYKCVTIFSYTGYNSLTVEYVWKKIIKEQNNPGSGSGETSRIVGAIENLQIAKITGLTSEVIVEPVTE